MRKWWVILGCIALVFVFLSAADAGQLSRLCNRFSYGIPPQTLPEGWESTECLNLDAERNERPNVPLYSAWLVESTRFVDVPWGSFQPDHASANINIDFPANYGIIKAKNGDIVLYDSGWKQLPYIYDWNNSCCGSPALQQMPAMGLDPAKVKAVVVGHGHWDHAGQLDSFPDAILFIQNQELKQIDYFINYPIDFNQGHIRAVNTINPLTGEQIGPPQQSCARTPVCGYPPQTLAEINGKVLNGKAHIVDGRFDMANAGFPGLIIHPAFRGHTYGSQLLQVNTMLGQIVFGSDTYSSWTGIRDWLVANIQQTDTIQQFLAYEKCYALTASTGSFNNCLAAHEREAFGGTSSDVNTANYPITSNWWTIPEGNCSRAAELTLANGQKSLVKKGDVVVNGKTIPAQYPANLCRANVFVRPTGYPIEP